MGENRSVKLPTVSALPGIRMLLRRAWLAADSIGLMQSALVSVQDSRLFWEKHGYRVAEDLAPGQRDKLASHGAPNLLYDARGNSFSRDPSGFHRTMVPFLPNGWRQEWPRHVIALNRFGSLPFHFSRPPGWMSTRLGRSPKCWWSVTWSASGRMALALCPQYLEQIEKEV